MAEEIIHQPEGDAEHHSGIMGTKPSQSIFLGNMALVLLALMIICAATAIISGLTHPAVY